MVWWRGKQICSLKSYAHNGLTASKHREMHSQTKEKYVILYVVRAQMKKNQTGRTGYNLSTLHIFFSLLLYFCISFRYPAYVNNRMDNKRIKHKHQHQAALIWPKRALANTPAVIHFIMQIRYRRQQTQK